MKNRKLIFRLSFIIILLLIFASYTYVKASNKNISSDDWFVVNTNNKFAVVDKDENFIVKPQYDFIGRNVEGYSRVMRFNK